MDLCRRHVLPAISGGNGDDNLGDNGDPGDGGDDGVPTTQQTPRRSPRRISTGSAPPRGRTGERGDSADARRRVGMAIEDAKGSATGPRSSTASSSTWPSRPGRTTCCSRCTTHSRRTARRVALGTSGRWNLHPFSRSRGDAVGWSNIGRSDSDAVGLYRRLVHGAGTARSRSEHSCPASFRQRLTRETATKRCGPTLRTVRT